MEKTKKVTESPTYNTILQVNKRQIFAYIYVAYRRDNVHFCNPYHFVFNSKIWLTQTL